MKKLIPLSDFVLEQLKIQQSTSEFKEVVRNYTHFLKQPLTLGMFVPVDFVGNVLKEPKIEEYDVQKDILIKFNFENDLKRYNEIKKKVLFEGCEVKEIKTDKNYFVVYHKSRQIWISWTDRIIEDMILNRAYLNGLELTPSALEAVGIKE